VGEEEEQIELVDDAAEIEAETIVDRVIALKQIVPPSIRYSSSNAYSMLFAASKVVGNLGWIVVTTFLICGVPALLNYEQEQLLLEYEAQMKQQQAGGGSPMVNVNPTLSSNPALQNPALSSLSG